MGDYSQQYPERYDHPDWKAPEVIVIWGNNPVVANSDGLFGHWVVDCMKRGSKLITIDPRVTWLAARSEAHLGIRPGTDAALALGMIDYIIKTISTITSSLTSGVTASRSWRLLRMSILSPKPLRSRGSPKRKSHARHA